MSAPSSTGSPRATSASAASPCSSGLVREMHVREGLHRDRIDALTLEHYPGMTEKAL